MLPCQIGVAFLFIWVNFLGIVKIRVLLQGHFRGGTIGLILIVFC